MEWNFNFAFIEYGELWRTRRRMIHQFMHEKASKAFDDIISRKAERLVQRIFKAPEEFRADISE